jgi:(E)-4-hydroxy-3-methylbut-2-enyl-diphosphate synthase
MADADFGYVGGAPGKVDLYVGKDVIKRAIPNELACDALVQLIKDNNRCVVEMSILRRARLKQLLRSDFRPQLPL